MAHFTIAFESGTSAYIPLDTDAEDRLREKEAPLFSLNTFIPNKDIEIPIRSLSRMGSMVLRALGPHSPPVSTMSREVKRSLADAEMKESRSVCFQRSICTGWRSIRQRVLLRRGRCRYRLRRSLFGVPPSLYRAKLRRIVVGSRGLERNM